MVSSGESSGVVDTGAGSIVWVRRRNGSWWPGRILGPHDLSASHVMSPRSGTPVKLLGREDASVDWYNLEKSKRVKAFRCGEFDDCIERAEASQGLPAKKREKYARREDAILHALQLEKQFLHNKFPTLVAPTPTPTSNAPSVLPSVDVNTNLDQSSFVPTLEHNPSVEMGSQLKGLQDVILTAVPLNRMISSTASQDSNPTAIATATAIATEAHFQNSSDSDSRNSTDKGKRLLEGYAHEPIPKRHHPLGVHPFINTSRNSAHMYARPFSLGGSEFMPPESSHMFTTNQAQIDLPFFRPVLATPHAQLATFADDALSGSSEETHSDSSETHSVEPRVEAGMLLSDAETSVRAHPRLALQAGPESISSDGSDEASLGDRSQFHYLEQHASGAEVSKWQLKGKRNVRNMGKRPMDRFTQRTYLDARGRPLNLRESIHSQSYCHDNGFANDAGVSEDDYDLHTYGFGQRGYLPSEAAARGHSYTGQNMIDWELAWGRSFRGYWEERNDCFSPTLIGRNGRDILIDVDLEVQASHQGEHVPWVSLMSKLDGKAIIGHPIQIESLEDGSTDTLLLTSDEYRYESDRGKVPPMWTTARRTANVRVPRPHQSSQLDIDEEHLHHQTGVVRSKKSTASSYIRKGSLSKITNSHVSRSPQVKASRKGNSVSNQKTKPLSSIGFDQKVINKTRGHDSGHYLDGVIKSANSEPTTVACIPVKLAFSRLLEAVGRPPSGLSKQGTGFSDRR